MKIPEVSIAMPVCSVINANYLLNRAISSILSQSFTDYEIIITDNSDDDSLESFVKSFKGNIHYHHNEFKESNGASSNTNEAIKRCKGRLIKILYMDDWFAHENALQTIIEVFKDKWLISATDDNPNPRYTQDIHCGNNKLGSPSALTILNENPLLFNESLSWMLDCDYYKRMYTLHGEPTILNDINVNIGKHEGQLTNSLSQSHKIYEMNLVANRYA